jgi:20S proteasome alpha/beta subunit
MTLTVALIGTDGIIAATDSRGTFGDPRGTTAQNDTMQKLFGVTDCAVILAAGTAELAAQLMIEIQQCIATEGAVAVTRVMEITRETARKRYKEWFEGFMIQQIQGVAAPVRPGLQMIVAGYDADEASAFLVPRIYQLAAEYDFAPMLSSHGFALQGVPQYALYLLNRLYTPDSSSGELQALAAYVITETASQDGKVGGPVQMAAIQRGGGCRILAPAEVEDITRANEQRSEQLRSSFFAKGTIRSGH